MPIHKDHEDICLVTADKMHTAIKGSNNILSCPAVGLLIFLIILLRQMVVYFEGLLQGLQEFLRKVFFRI